MHDGGTVTLPDAGRTQRSEPNLSGALSPLMAANQTVARKAGKCLRLYRLFRWFCILPGRIMAD